MKNKKLLFIIGAYGIFWVLLLVTGLLMSLGMPQWGVKTASTICAWSPTAAVLILFKKLDTGFSSRTEFIKSRFEGKGWFRIALILFLAQTALFFGGMWFVSLYYKCPYGELFVFSPELVIISVITTALGGALGEELGWRGYLFCEQRKKYGIIKSSVINGIVWVLWHVPLWFIRGGNGRELLVYIIAFSVSSVSISVVMGVFYDKIKNLAIPIVIHFTLNFWVCFITPEISVHIPLSVLAVLYFIAAVVCVIYQNVSEKTYS